MRLPCVVALTVVVIFTLCKTAKVTARATGAVEPQTHGLDTLLLTDQLRQSRRRRARLLESLPPLSIITKFTRTRFGMWLFPFQFLKRSTDRQAAVTILFNFHNVKALNADGFFLSKQFRTWEKQVKTAYRDDSEQLLFDTMCDEFSENNNGGVEAIIAQAIENGNRLEMGLRFEDLLLQKLIVGINEKKLNLQKDFVRYVHYRGMVNVELKLQQMAGKVLQPTWFLNIEKHLFFNSGYSFDNLQHFFLSMSRGKKIKNVFDNLGPVEGFNNNAFLLNLLHDKASDKTVPAGFVHFVLTTLHEAGWTDSKISITLLELEDKEIPYDLHDKLLKPMAGRLMLPKPLLAGQA